MTLMTDISRMRRVSFLSFFANQFYLRLDVGRTLLLGKRNGRNQTYGIIRSHEDAVGTGPGSSWSIRTHLAGRISGILRGRHWLSTRPRRCTLARGGSRGWGCSKGKQGGMVVVAGTPKQTGH